jgi:hypothetical protein
MSHNHTATVSTTTELTGSVEKISETFNVNGVASGVFTKETGYPDNRTPGTVNTGDTGKLLIDVNHNHTTEIGYAGGGLPHLNIQPSYACYYIQYRP